MLLYVQLLRLSSIPEGESRSHNVFLSIQLIFMIFQKCMFNDYRLGTPACLYNESINYLLLFYLSTPAFMFNKSH